MEYQPSCFLQLTDCLNSQGTRAKDGVVNLPQPHKITIGSDHLISFLNALINQAVFCHSHSSLQNNVYLNIWENAFKK